MTTQDDVLQTTIRRLNERAWGTAVGLLMAIGLFIATNVLVLKGGVHVGQHLNLLAIYLPGYRVTFMGSLIGFVYMFVIGYALGRLIGMVYNKMVGPVRRDIQVL
jgi:hypothetical protein